MALLPLGALRPADPHVRRLVRVRIAYTALGVLLRHQGGGVGSLPHDVRVEDVFTDPSTRTLTVVLSSISFQPVPPGGVIPELRVWITW